MGKQERTYVELLERNVDKYLRNATLDELKNEDNRRVKELGDYIKENFVFTCSKHIGNNYGSSLGDLVLIGDKEIYIELKFLQKGKGTLANISQNALTNYNFFIKSDILSWEKFRDQNSFSKTVFEMLFSYKNYSLNDLPTSPSKANIESLARELKSKAVSDIKAKNIKEKIAKYAKQNKINYIRYLSNKEIDKDSIRKFTLLILLGRHTVDSLDQYKDLSYQETSNLIENNYNIIYIHKGNMKDIYSMENIYNKIECLKSYDVKLNFPSNETNITIDYYKNNHWIKAVRFSFHWKNVFQGIKTPCLNVFNAGAENLFI